MESINRRAAYISVTGPKSPPEKLICQKFTSKTSKSAFQQMERDLKKINQISTELYSINFWIHCSHPENLIQILRLESSGTQAVMPAKKHVLGKMYIP